MCNKISFVTAKEARDFIKITSVNSKRNSKNNRAKKVLRQYFCDECKNFHLTSASKTDDRKTKKSHRQQKKKLDKIKELQGIKELDKKFEWLESNTADWIHFHDDGRRYLTFDGVTTRVLME